MIGSTGGQYWPTPEMYKYHNIMYPEYIDANSRDEIQRAVRENMLFGARTIKLCIDCKPWGYSVDDIKLAISEAAKGGCKVEGHVQTPEGAQRAIDAGIYIIAHGNALTPDHHRQMAEKGIILAGTDTPYTPYRGTEQGFKRTVDNLKDAWQKKVPLTYSTDFDYWNERMKNEKTGEWLTRGLPAGARRLLAGGGGNGTVYYRDDGQSDWTESLLENDRLAAGLAPLAALWTGHSWLVGTNIGAFHSALGQSPWTFIDFDLRPLFFMSFALQGGTVFAHFANGEGTGIEYSRDDGVRELGQARLAMSEGRLSDCEAHVQAAMRLEE